MLKKKHIKQSNLKLNYIFFNYSILSNFFNKKKIIINKYKTFIFLKEMGTFIIFKKFLFFFYQQKLLK